ISRLRTGGVVLTEADWWRYADPEPMLAFLADRLTDRKLRLYFCAWAGEVWHRMNDERSKTAVETAELFADRAGRRGHAGRRRARAGRAGRPAPRRQRCRGR